MWRNNHIFNQFSVLLRFLLLRYVFILNLRGHAVSLESFPGRHGGRETSFSPISFCFRRDNGYGGCWTSGIFPAEPAVTSPFSERCIRRLSVCFTGFSVVFGKHFVLGGVMSGEHPGVWRNAAPLAEKKAWQIRYRFVEQAAVPRGKVAVRYFCFLARAVRAV